MMANSLKKYNLRIGWVVIFLTVTATYLFFYFGIWFVIDAYTAVSNISAVNRNEAVSYLSGSYPENNVVKGILLRLPDSEKLDGVWVWNYGGIGYYKVEKLPNLSLFSICRKDIWKKSSAEIIKDVNINYGKWYGKIRRGDYLEMELTNDGVVESITDYDWWVFAQPLPFSYFEQACISR